MIEENRLVETAREAAGQTSYSGDAAFLRSLIRQLIPHVVVPEDHELPKGVKVYTTKDGPVAVLSGDADVLDMARHHRQCGLYVAARTKVEAVTILDPLGYGMPIRDLQVATGTDMEALVRAGVIVPDRSVILSAGFHGSGVARVHRDDHGHRYAQLVGRFARPSREPKFERIML